MVFPEQEGTVMEHMGADRTLAVQSYRYACTDSAVGRLLVVMTETAVVDVILGDDFAHMLGAASARHPGATFTPDRGVNAGWVAQIVKRFEQPPCPPAVSARAPARSAPGPRSGSG